MIAKLGKITAAAALFAGVSLAGLGAGAPFAAAEDDPAAANVTGSPLLSEAELYARYQRAVGALGKTAVSSNADLGRALSLVAGHDAQKVGRGWLAYSAILASGNTDFAAAVRKAADSYGREHMLEVFASGSPFVLGLDGAAAAQQSVLAAAKADSERIGVQGARFLKLGYDLQKLPWGSARDSGDALRSQIAAAKTDGSVGAFDGLKAAGARVFAAFTGGQAWDSAGAAGDAQLTSYATAGEAGAKPAARPGLTLNPARAATMTAILDLAAYDILKGEAAGAEPLLTEKSSARCFRDEDDGFRQCVTAMTERFSRAACIGGHGLGAPPAGGQEAQGVRKCVASLVKE